MAKPIVTRSKKAYETILAFDAEAPNADEIVIQEELDRLTSELAILEKAEVAYRFRQQEAAKKLADREALAGIGHISGPEVETAHKEKEDIDQKHLDLLAKVNAARDMVEDAHQRLEQATAARIRHNKDFLMEKLREIEQEAAEALAKAGFLRDRCQEVVSVLRHQKGFGPDKSRVLSALSSGFFESVNVSYLKHQNSLLWEVLEAHGLVFPEFE